MKRSRLQALAALTLSVCLFLGCESVLGIHSGTLADAGPSKGGTGGTPLEPLESPGGHATGFMGGAGDAGPREDRGGSSVSAGGAGGSTSDSGGNAGGGGIISAMGGVGGLGGARGLGGEHGGQVGRDAPDAGATDGGSDARPATDVGGICVSPWTASAVTARVLSLNSDGKTACGFAGTELPARVAALDTAHFLEAAACGACLRVRAVPGGASVVVPVVEVTGSDGVLLSRAAMDQVAAGATTATVDWSLVPCDIGTSTVRYRINEGSSANYLAVRVGNERYPLASVSIVTTAGLLALKLQSWGYWETRAAGAGPVTFRLVDINGQSFDEPNVKLVPQSEYVGKGQFPVCH